MRWAHTNDVQHARPSFTMANRTDPMAMQMHGKYSHVRTIADADRCMHSELSQAHALPGTNPQNLVEKILRMKVYGHKYWKEHCFGLSAETLVEKVPGARFWGKSDGRSVLLVPGRGVGVPRRHLWRQWPAQPVPLPHTEALANSA